LAKALDDGSKERDAGDRGASSSAVKLDPGHRRQTSLSLTARRPLGENGAG
jgi:hypothetical protein